MSVIKMKICRFKLFRQPYKVGAVIGEANDLLILGIGRFEITYDTLHVWYICQDLSANLGDKQQLRNVASAHGGVEISATVKYDDRQEIEKIQLGNLIIVNGYMHKILEYTALELKGVDLQIDLIARAMHPVGQKEAQTKQRAARRKKLNIEIVSP